MSLDTTPGFVFLTSEQSGGPQIRFLQLKKSQGINLEFWYLNTATGHKFDVRDFSQEALGIVSREHGLPKGTR